MGTSSSWPKQPGLVFAETLPDESIELGHPEPVDVIRELVKDRRLRFDVRRIGSAAPTLCAGAGRRMVMVEVRLRGTGAR